jgi:hypothetical protein
MEATTITKMKQLLELGIIINKFRVYKSRRMQTVLIQAHYISPSFDIRQNILRKKWPWTIV